MELSNNSNFDLFINYQSKAITLKKNTSVVIDIDSDAVSLLISPDKKSKTKIQISFAGLHTMTPSNLSSILFCSMSLEINNINADSQISFYDIEAPTFKSVTFSSVGFYAENCSAEIFNYSIINRDKLLKKMKKISFLLSGLPIWIACIPLILILKKFKLLIYAIIILIASIVMCIWSIKNLSRMCTDYTANKTLTDAVTEKIEDYDLLKELGELKNAENTDLKSKLFYKLSEHILKKW